MRLTPTPSAMPTQNPTSANTPSQAPVVACPTCGEPTLFAPSNTWRPFCSQRCKHIDLGAWAAEEFRVPTEPPPDAPDDDPRQAL